MSVRAAAATGKMFSLILKNLDARCGKCGEAIITLPKIYNTRTNTHKQKSTHTHTYWHKKGDVFINKMFIQAARRALSIHEN